MFFTSKSADLLNAVKMVATALPSTTPQTPLLSAVFMRTSGNGTLELQATDYMIGVSTTIPATVENEQAHAVLGSYACSVVNALPGDGVTVSGVDNTLKLQSGDTSYRLLQVPADKYPCLAPLQGDLSFTVKASVLRSLIYKVRYACAKDDARPMLTGVLMATQGNNISMTATNAHRAAVNRATLDVDTGELRQSIIPARATDAVMTMLNGVDGDTLITVNCTDTEVSFALEHTYITARLFDGTFPDVTRMMASQYATTCRVSRAQFLAALARVNLIARSLDYNVIRVSAEQGRVVLRAINTEVGDAVDSIPAEVNGSDIATAFNGEYLSDVVKRLDGDDFLMSFNQVLTPLSIREVPESAFNYIVTPVRVRE